MLQGCYEETAPVEFQLLGAPGIVHHTALRLCYQYYYIDTCSLCVVFMFIVQTARYRVKVRLN